MKATNIYCTNNHALVNGHEVKILMKKHFPLVKKLNSFLRNAVEGGLVKKWLANEEVFRKFDRIDPFYSAVTTEALMGFGLYFVVGTTLSLAFLTAIAEQIIDKRAKQPNAKKFWIIADKAIDPQRYFLLNDIKW